MMFKRILKFLVIAEAVLAAVWFAVFFLISDCETKERACFWIGRYAGEVFYILFWGAILLLAMLVTYYIWTHGQRNKLTTEKQETDPQKARESKSTLRIEITYWLLGFFLPWLLILDFLKSILVSFDKFHAGDVIIVALIFTYFCITSFVFWHRINPPRRRSLYFFIILVLLLLAVWL